MIIISKLVEGKLVSEDVVAEAVAEGDADAAGGDGEGMMVALNVVSAREAIVGR